MRIESFFQKKKPDASGEISHGERKGKTTRREFLKGAAAGALVGGDLLESAQAATKRGKDIERQFSWVELLQEADGVKKNYPGSWRQEIRRRIRNGVEKYFQVAAREFRESDKKGFALGAAGGIGAWLTKISGGESSFRNLEDINKVLLFGSAGAGAGIVLERLDEILREQNPEVRVVKLKQGAEDAAFKALSLEETEEGSENPLRTDDLATVITSNIAEHEDYLRSDIKPATMLEQWGAGAALMVLPTRSILHTREKKLTGKGT